MTLIGSFASGNSIVMLLEIKMNEVDLVVKNWGKICFNIHSPKKSVELAGFEPASS